MARKKKAKKATAGRKATKKATAKKATRTTKAGARGKTAAKKKTAATGKRKPRKTEAQVLAILREADKKGSNAAVIRKFNLSPATFYAWKRKHGDM